MNPQREVAMAAIVNCARAAIAAEGFEQLRMGEVAAAAGTSRASLYRYYESKDALRQAVLRQGVIDAFTGIDLYGYGDDPDERLDALFAVLINHLESDAVFTAALRCESFDLLKRTALSSIVRGQMAHELERLLPANVGAEIQYAIGTAIHLAISLWLTQSVSFESFEAAKAYGGFHLPRLSVEVIT